MVADIGLPIEIIIGPIIREASGLAMSSRNVRLSNEQRKIAALLYGVLQDAADELSVPDSRGSEFVILAACRLGPVRLIDNVVVETR